MLIAKTSSECNTPAAGIAIYPHSIAPTYYCWCSYHIVGRRVESDADAIWREALAACLDSGSIPIRSPDGQTVYIVPPLTNVVWGGEC